MMRYDVDEFDQLMEASFSGGQNLHQIRMSKSVPTSPASSPKKETPDSISINNVKGSNHDFGEPQEVSTHTNVLVPPGAFQEPQDQVNGSSRGARPKLVQLYTGHKDLGLPASGGIRRTQSCRRPAAPKREQTQHSYRQRAHANAWKQQTHASIDEEAVSQDLESPHVGAPECVDQVGNDDENLQECKIYRMRSFKTTSAGIENRGDSFKVKSRRQSSKYRQSPGLKNRRMSADTTGSMPSGDALMGNSPLRHPKVIALGSGSPTPCRPSVLNVGNQCTRPDSLMPIDDRIQEEPSPNKPGRRFSGERGGFSPTALLQDTGIEADELIEEDEEEPGVHKVIVVGAQGVGKSTLTRQLLTSEYLANTDRYLDDDQEKVKIVSVMLDEQESMIKFINVRNIQEAKETEDVDAYLIVFSVTDHNSFSYAHACLQDLTRKGTPSRKKVVIVVANKQDSMRSRVVSEEEARYLASSNRHCKYTEVSALLDHKVDELLVGIIRQIRLNQTKQQLQAQCSGPGPSRRIGCLRRAAVSLLHRLFRRHGSGDSGDNDLLAP